MSDYESELDLDTSKSTIDETMTSLTSFAETHAKEVNASKVAPPLPTPGSVGLQRPRRSAFAAAEASIKRSYEEYGQSLAEATEVVKKARKELAAITVPVKITKTEVGDEIYKASARVTRGKGKAPATPANSHASLDEEDSEAEVADSHYEDVAAVHNGNDSDGDWDEESLGLTIDKEELGDEFLIDESEDLLDGVDAIDLIGDDEYVRFEDDDEGNDDVSVDDGSESDDDAGTSEPLPERPRVVSAEVNAAKWVADYNASHPVDPDDEDVLRFNRNLTRIIKRCCRWATEGNISAWYNLPRFEREMTMASRIIFQKAAVNPDNLIQIILEGMPLQTRKVLGKKDLDPLDLLDLPVIPRKCKHRLVYLDVATRLPRGKIQRVQRVLRGSDGNLSFKEATSPADLRQASQVKLYVGSSVSVPGAHTRIRKHEAIANGHQKEKKLGFHYREVVKADVVPNFRMLGVWQNPHADGSFDGQDVALWIAPMVEGLMMVYLGLYTEKHMMKDLPAIFTLPSYDLVNRIRHGIALPDFTDISLNRAWSLCQGFHGSTKPIQHCANPECRRPRVVSEDTLLGTKPTRGFRCLVTGDLLAPGYCPGCSRHYKMYGGELRTREGLSTGRWYHENDSDAINQAWLAGNGGERRCCNEKCNVRIHSLANLYGVERSIRCLRCHTYRYEHKKEYSEAHQDPEHTGNCQVCNKQDVRIFCWNQVLKQKNKLDDLPSEICEDCYSVRCSFLEVAVPDDPHPRTVPACGNLACWSRPTRGGNIALVENIQENIWRCQRCDYCHEAGVESFSRRGSVPKPPTGPIASHRFNSTSCVDCERYISYAGWEKAGDGYRCASCTGRKCADCNVAPAMVHLMQNADGQLRCPACVPKHKLAVARNVDPDGPTTVRTCCNESCGATTADGVYFWHRDPKDQSLSRCSRCYQYLKAHGTEWFLPSKCYNEDCDETGADVKLMTGPDGKVRCTKCQSSFVRTGMERLCKATCHNFSHCGRDYTNFSGPFRRDPVDGNARCENCHNVWIAGGSQFERGFPFPHLTKAQKAARICSRPACSRTRATWGKLHRWKDFVPDGWVCDPCFKELKVEQKNSARAAGPAAAGDPDEDANACGDGLE
jgi:hypothetical protein